MRKVLFLLVVLLVLPFAPVRAVDVSSGPAAMAQYMPSGAVFFFAMRVDDGFVDELQTVADRVLSKVPAEFGLPPMNLRDTLKQAFAASPVPYEEIRAALGDRVAIGALNNANLFGMSERQANDDGLLFAVEVADRAKMASLLLLMPGTTETGTDGEYTLYTATNGAAAMNDHVLLVSSSPRAMELVRAGDSLSKDADFNTTTAALPADSYNMLAYTNLSKIMSASPDMNAATLSMMGMSVEDLGSVGVGLTILDGRALVIDMVQTAKVPGFSTMTYNPVNPVFLHAIPAGTDFLIHANNLSGLLETVLTMIDMTVPPGQPKPSLQLGGMVGMTGLNLQQDIIGKATGDFAIFGDIDVQGAFNQLGNSANTSLESLPLKFGLAIEMVDAASADNMAKKLGQFSTMMAAGSNTVRIGNATVNGVAVTNISMDARPAITKNIEIMIGAKDTLFFVGTSDVVQHITGGGSHLGGESVYNDAAKYMLPGATQVFYANDEGLVVGLAVPALALIAPTVDRVFDRIVEDLQTSALPQQSTRQQIQFNPNAEIRQMMLAIQTLNDIIASSSISSSRTGSMTLTRMVLTLE